MKSSNTSYIIRNTAFILFAAFILSSCRTHRENFSDDDIYGVNMRELARAGLKLGFDVDETDDWPLLIEVSKWIGVPYLYGGNTKRGVDCSGLTTQVFNTVYGIKLHRRSIEQYTKDCKSVAQKHLQMGDLVFFATGSSQTTVSHVGIYLKRNKFIHASSSRGVVVSNLSENYYKKHWISGGRVKSH